MTKVSTNNDNPGSGAVGLGEKGSGAELAPVSSRAREMSSREVVDERARYIGELMAEGRWQSRAMTKELCERWGVGPRQVRYYARLASGELWNDKEDLEELRANALAKLEQIAESACATGEWAMATKAIDTMAEITGIKAPRQQRIAHSAEGGAGLVIFLPAEDPRDLEAEDE